MNIPSTTSVSINPRVVCEEDAARFLGISRSALRKGRMVGRRDAQMSSPPFVKMGRRVGYLIEDLEEWLKRCRQGDELGIGSSR